MANDESVGNGKLIQYLTEAHGKEVELQVALTEHIEIATKDTYKKRLKDHLKETRQHAKLVERRVKKLGGNVNDGPVSKAASGVANAASAATKLPATAVKGAGQALRGTGEEEKQLKNAKTEYFNEHEEIANYTAIEALATALGDKETAKMAKVIRRQEERMASFLEKQIPQLTKAVVMAEVPASERRKSSSSGRKRSSSSSSSSRKSPSGRAGSTTKSASSRSTKRASGTTKSRSSATKRKSPAKKK